MSKERVPSVKERKSYFETLGASSSIVVSKNANSSRKQRPLSEVPVPITKSANIPPEKPKRTFEHNIYLEIASLSANTRLAPRPPLMPKPQKLKEDDNNNNSQEKDFKISLPKVSDVSYYAVSPLPLRRHHSHEELYATPITEKERPLAKAGQKFHPKLYYASVSVRDGREIAKELKKESDNPTTLLRKYAFKKQRKLKSHGRCEHPSKLHDTRALNSDLDRRSSRAQIVRRSTLVHKAKVEEFCDQADPRLFEAAFIIALQEIVDESTGKVKTKPAVQYAFPEKMEKESIYARMAVLFYPDYSHQQKIGQNEWEGDEEFMVAMTDVDGSRRYAYCVRYLPSLASVGEKHEIYPQVLAVISPIRNSIFYMDLVRNMHSYAKKGAELLDGFLHSVHRNAYSSKQGWSLKVVEKLSNGFVRSIEIKNYGQSLGKTGCAAIIHKISPEVTACLVAALLAEQRILIAGNSVGETDIHPMIRPPYVKHMSCSITRVVQMLEALIRPFTWPHTFIPIVPDNLLELCDNPTPYLMGILRSNLNRVKELIVDKKNDHDKRQMDFVFVDIELGVVVPSPDTDPPTNNTLDSWRYENAIKFCMKMGWTRKMSTNMIKGFREAISAEPAAAADLKIMLKWYAELFGHYRFVGAHQVWDDESKELLVSAQPIKEYRHYLGYLRETVMFEDWIISRLHEEKNGNMLKGEEPLPSSEDDLNNRIDKYWISEFNSFTPKELRQLAHRVTHYFGRFRRH